MFFDISGCEARKLVEEGAQFVDVRTPNEYAQGALPGAINLPVQLIHNAANQLRKDIPTIVYCVSGQRSAFAQRLLQSMGFDQVHNLGPYRNYLEC